MRLDIFLSLHHAISRNRAKQLIQAGLVFIDDTICKKTSEEVSEKNSIVLLDDKRVHWVSRSALKLDGFLEVHIEISVSGKKCLDVGSSTGGFTQVLLERGASSVDAVDVGTDQLHERIKNDSRVVSYEQTDIREFVPRGGSSQVPGNAHSSDEGVYDMIVCDASFIALSQIFDAIVSHAGESTEILLLFKPQFEVGKEKLRKTGVPKDETSILEAMTGFEDILAKKQCSILAKEKSCLMGEAGNQEWIYWIRKK